MKTQLILLSGGMDSATALAAADSPRLALSVDYGQRHVKELEAARRLAAHYGVEHQILDLTGWGKLLTGSSLIDPSVEVPHGHYAAPSMKLTVVPNRNAVLLMAAVGIALSRGIDEVVTAVHAGDHAVYPDCRPEFIREAHRTAQVATEGLVAIDSPFVNITKTQIAELGASLGVPYALTWSCYEGKDKHCGRCGTCVERHEAFTDAHLEDPTEYAS